jgi:mannan endo-1,4-beta-mannosidase
VVALIFVAHVVWWPGQASHHPPRRDPDVLPTRPASYLGLYRTGVPASYAPITDFTMATGVSPRVVTYYSRWMEPFQARFAMTVARGGAVPLVQIDPNNISVAAIAAGKYDGYLSRFASAVRSYRHPIIISFCHEMNGYWYSWGYRHTSPALFVAAWRHVVTLFRQEGASNVTWMWTVNIIHASRNIPSPARWWPGKSYVTWVGIDGYYYSSAWKFASLFGPTILAVRQLTGAPILIAETGAAQETDQPAKIADLFAGVRLYGLLGFVWFDADHTRDWRLSSPAAIAAFRRGAQSYPRPTA